MFYAVNPCSAKSNLCWQYSLSVQNDIRRRRSQSDAFRLGLRFGTNHSRLLRGFWKLNDAESVNFHCVPNQVLYQAEPLAD